MLATTLADHADQVRHDVEALVKRRDKATGEYEAEVAAIDAELLEKRSVLDDYETFFEWQHQRDGGSATIRDVRVAVKDGAMLTPDEYELAQRIVLYVPEEQRPESVVVLA